MSMAEIYNFTTDNLPDWKTDQDRDDFDIRTAASRDMQARGVTPPDTFILDGRIHRFGPENVCWYFGFDDAHPLLQWADWSDLEGVHEVKGFTNLSPEDDLAMKARVKQAMAQRKAEEEKMHREAAARAQELWERASIPTETHPYFVRKKITPHTRYRVMDGKVVLRVFSPEGQLQSLQFIQTDGSKRFLAGGATRGGYGVISGSLSVFLCEGCATAESIHAATGGTVYYSFSAHNLKPVYDMLVEQHQMPVVVADNDESGTGEAKARECTDKFVLIPVTGMDANDYASEYGITALSEILDEPLPFITATQFVKEIDSMEYLVKGFLYQQAFSCFFGESGKGKTFTIVDIACSIACDRVTSWNGRRMEHGTVVLFEGEGMKGLRLRTRAWMESHGVDVLDDLLIYNGPPQGLDQTAGLAYIKSILMRLKATGRNVVWTVFDTFNRFFHGDENSAQEVGAFVRGCTELINELDIALTIVHHSGVSELSKDRGRGSSALRAGLDTEYKVSQDDSGMISIECTKMKDGDAPAAMYGHIIHHDFEGLYDKDGDQISSAYFTLYTQEEIEAEKRRIQEEANEAKKTKAISTALASLNDMMSEIGFYKEPTEPLANGTYHFLREHADWYLEKMYGLDTSKKRSEYITKTDDSGNHFIADLAAAGILIVCDRKKSGQKMVPVEWRLVEDYCYTTPVSDLVGDRSLRSVSVRFSEQTKGADK